MDTSKLREHALRRQKQREHVLLALHHLGRGAGMCLIPTDLLLPHLKDLSPVEITEVLSSLRSDGLIAGAPDAVVLLEEGVAEVARLLREQPVAPTVTNNTSVDMRGATVGAVQTGDHNAATVSQTVGVGGREMREALVQLRQGISMLSEKQKAEASEYVEVLEVQAKSEHPHEAMVKVAARELLRVISVSSDVGGLIGLVMLILSLFGFKMP